jgi:DNA polymerase III alpha subunit
MKRAQSNGIEEGVFSRTLKSVQAKSRHALCKAHIFTTAHLALQTAFVKAHRPDEFQAMASVLRSEMLH